MSDRSCPNQDELSGYLLGTIPEDSAESISAHLNECDDCEATVDALETASDTMIEKLRKPRPVDRYAELEACQRAVALVEQFGRDPSFTGQDSAEDGGEDESDLGSIRVYKLLAKIGEGGMGAVYKARHTELDKIVALKVLPAEKMKDASAVGRFKREMKAVGRLDHQHIVRAMDAGEEDGKHYLVMEYVKGVDLSELIRRHGRLRVADACELVRQAAVGLDEAHHHGMVHRDIKPSNLMLAVRRNKPPQVKILDMGLALLDSAPQQRELTSTGQMMGTLNYMAPEQGMDSHEVDIRADIYSLGATLYKLLCGDSPFSTAKYDTPVKLMMALATEEVPSISTKCADLPAELVAVVHKMLAKNPDNRYATPAEVVAALAPFVAESNLAALEEAKPEGDTSPSASASESPAPTIPRGEILECGDSSPHSLSLPATTNKSGDESPHSKDTLGQGLRPAPKPASLQTPKPMVRNAYPTRWRPYTIATAAGLAGVILLGILLTIRFGDVVVTVEAPDGKLPDDVKLLLKSEGQEIEITAADQWKMKVSPGQYGVEVQGGNDQFAIQDDTMTVSRGGKNILIVRRKSAASADTRDAMPGASVSANAEGNALNGRANRERHEINLADAEVLRRLASVDWKPAMADDRLRGVVASPAAIDGIAGSWQIRHAQGYYQMRGYQMRWLSPKGNYVCLNYEGDPTGVIFEVKTGRPVGAIHVPHGWALSNCSWSSDEKHIAYCGHQQRTVHIASRDGVSETSSFEVQGKHVSSLAWSPNGSKFAIWQSHQALGFYSPSGELLQACDDASAAGGGKWSPDSKYFAVAHYGNPVIEADTGRTVCTHGGAMFKGSLSWTPDSKSIYSFYAGSYKVTHVNDGVTTEALQRSLPAASSPDGRYSLWMNGEIQDPVGKVAAKLDLSHVPGPSCFVWDDPDRIRVVSEPFPGFWAEYSPTGRVLASGSTPLWMPVEYGTWLADDDKIISNRTGHLESGLAARQFIWSVSGDGDAMVELPDHEIEFTGITGTNSSISPDGKLLAWLSYQDGSVEIRQDEKTIRKLSGLARGQGLQWNPTGTHLCGWGYHSGTVCVWNVADGSLVKKLEGMVFGLRNFNWRDKWSSPRWSPDGTRLAMLSTDTLHIVPIAEDGGRQIDWKGRNSQCPIYWTPNGDGLLIDGKLYDTEGREIGELKDADGNLAEFQWLESSSGAVGVSGSNVLIWPTVRDRGVRVALPGYSRRDLVRPKDQGANVQQLSPSSRYWTTIAVQDFGDGFHGRGDVVLVDLQERRVVWTGVAFSDGTMIRVGESGQILSGPEDLDPYLIYTIRYPEGVVVPLTQLQFAARIGLSPGQQCLQRILDLGGKVHVDGRDEWLTRADLKDARDLPALPEVTAISLAANPFVTSDTLAALEHCPALATLDLSGSRVEDVDLGSLLDLSGLRTLNLAGTPITGNVGAALPAGLEELDLSGTAVGDLLLKDLRSFKSLRRLNVTGTKVTDQGIDAFQKAVPDCEVIR